MPASPVTFDSRAAIDQFEPERDVEELLHLFLKDYFDGDEHTLASADAQMADVSFPQCDLFHGVASLPKASIYPQIHTIVNDNRPSRRCRLGDSTVTIERRTLFTHLIRAAHRGSSDQSQAARALSRRVADRLRLLYEHEPSLRLARKGFHHLRIERGPTEIPLVGYSLRQIVVSATITYQQSVSTIGAA